MLDPLAGRDSLPCLDCPKAGLDDYLATPMGRRILSAFDLDFALQVGFTITLDEVSYWEFCFLKILAGERQRWEREEIEKASRKHGR
jgi:hypothetical protein